MAAASARWRLKHPEGDKATQRKFREKPESKKKIAVWRARNIERVRETARAADRIRRKKHPEKFKAKDARRKALRLAATGSLTADDVLAQYAAQKGLCYWCGEPVGDSYHTDHIIALNVGGSNGPENICVTCPACNQSKQDKLPTEWDGNKTGRLL